MMRKRLTMMKERCGDDGQEANGDAQHERRRQAISSVGP